MYRQSPSRNQRPRGIKVKHILQICVLLAICFWLIYQVKHSHDKRKEFDESEGRVLVQGERRDDLIKLGRKDIQAREEGTVSKNEKHEESEDEEEEGGREDIEENKIEEDGREDAEENKIEEDEMESKTVEGKEDEAMEGGDDEVEEHELEKSHAEIDGEEDLVGEEKGREGSVKNGVQETDLEDASDEVTGKEISVVEDNHDGDDGSVDEAREEHYKADDASSAVTNDAQGNENQHLEKPKEILGDDHESNTTTAKEETLNMPDLYDAQGNENQHLEKPKEILGDDHESNTTTAKEETLNMPDNRSISTATPVVLQNVNVTVSNAKLDRNPETLISGFKTNTSNPVVNAESSHLNSEVGGSKKKKEVDENSESTHGDDERDAIDVSDTANFSDGNTLAEV